MTILIIILLVLLSLPVLAFVVVAGLMLWLGGKNRGR